MNSKIKITKTKIASIVITGLNVKSIKTFIKLNSPLVATIFWIEEYNHYKIEGENVWGSNWPYQSGILGVPNHVEYLTNDVIAKILTTNGLTNFRTTLKHMHNSGVLPQMGELLPLNKKENQTFTVQWE